MLGCACAFALHILFTDRGVREYEVGPLVAIQLGVCGLFCLIVAAIAGDLEAPSGWTVWSALLVTSVLASALGFFIQSYAQQRISPARTALILAAEPAFAGLFGFWLGDDRLSAVALAGRRADPRRDRRRRCRAAAAAAAAAAGGLAGVSAPARARGTAWCGRFEDGSSTRSGVPCSVIAPSDMKTT